MHMQPLQFILTLALGCITLQSAAQEELRPRTPGEDRFWKKADAVIRSAVTHQPGNGWMLVEESENDAGFQPTITRKKDNGPYYYAYEISYVRNPEVLARELDSVAKLVASDPGRAEELVKVMEQMQAGAECRMVVDLNSNYSVASFCTGKPSYPTYPAVAAAVRVPGAYGADASCDAVTMLLIGRFTKPRMDMNDGKSGVVSADGQLNGGGPFTVFNFSISITAAPEVADFFIRQTDIAALAALIGKNLQ